MKKILLFFIIISGATLTGCSSYAFIVDSNPGEADLHIKNSRSEIVYTGKTPAKVASKYIPKGDYIITLTKPGYEELRVLKGNQKTLKLKKMNLGTRSLKKND